MQTTITITSNSPTLVSHKTLTHRGSEPDFPSLFDSLIEQLEITLDNYRSWTDDLSTDLFHWGDKAITLVDSSEGNRVRLKEIASKHLGVLEELLISTQIELKAYEAKLPLDLKINKFALEMFNWMKEAQNLLGYTTNSEIANSLHKVNLSELPTPIAIQMYHHLRCNQKKIEEVRFDQCQIKATSMKPAPSLSVVRQSLMKEIRGAKTEMARKLVELEELTTLKIDIMKEKHQIEMELVEFRLNNTESDLQRFKTQLAYSEKQNEVNGQKNSQLNGEIDRLKNRIRNLESELDDNGGCILS